MKAVLWDGGRDGGADTAGVSAVLLDTLRRAGWETEAFDLREQQIAPCKGCFGCWIQTPGVCVTDDAARVSARAMAGADLAILVTPVTFGGYSSELKKMLDRSIGNISPFFTRIQGETHHEPRYDHAPDLLVVGVSEAAEESEAALFRLLAARNAVNLHAPRAVAEVVRPGDPVDGLLAAMGVSTTSSVADAPPVATLLPRFAAAGDVPAPDEGPGSPPSEVLLLVGSPRRRRSTSASLGGYLLDALEQRGARVSSLHLHTVLNEGPSGVERLLADFGRADLVILSSPLYVDSLPAGVIRAMETLHRPAPSADSRDRSTDSGDRLPGSGGRTLVAIVNSGFPESAHSSVALSICRRFAAESGLRWLGGLALGGGGAVDGRPLAEAGGMVRKARAALDLAADALAEGGAVPPESLRLMAAPAMPVWLYRMMTHRSWRRSAAAHGVKERLHDRPYASGGSGGR